nr:ATPase subunit 1, mitochondrial [Tanacetum cinerariifolium]
GTLDGMPRPYPSWDFVKCVSRISSFYTNFQVGEIGRVVSVGDAIARVYGLNKIQAWD